MGKGARACTHPHLLTELLAHFVLAIVGQAQSPCELNDPLRLLHTSVIVRSLCPAPLHHGCVWETTLLGSAAQHALGARLALTFLAFSSLRRSSSWSLDTSLSVSGVRSFTFTTESGIFLACDRSDRGARAVCDADTMCGRSRSRWCSVTKFGSQVWSFDEGSGQNIPHLFGPGTMLWYQDFCVKIS